MSNTEARLSELHSRVAEVVQDRIGGRSIGWEEVDAAAEIVSDLALGYGVDGSTAVKRLSDERILVTIGGESRELRTNSPELRARRRWIARCGDIGIEQVKAEEFWRAWEKVRSGVRTVGAHEATFRACAETFDARNKSMRGGVLWLSAGIAYHRARLVLRHAVILEECGGE